MKHQGLYLISYDFIKQILYDFIHYLNIKKARNEIIMNYYRNWDSNFNNNNNITMKDLIHCINRFLPQIKYFNNNLKKIIVQYLTTKYLALCKIINKIPCRSFGFDATYFPDKIKIIIFNHLTNRNVYLPFNATQSFVTSEFGLFFYFVVCYYF